MPLWRGRLSLRDAFELHTHFRHPGAQVVAFVLSCLARQAPGSVCAGVMCVGLVAEPDRFGKLKVFNVVRKRKMEK